MGRQVWVVAVGLVAGANWLLRCALCTSVSPAWALPAAVCSLVLREGIDIRQGIGRMKTQGVDGVGLGHGKGGFLCRLMKQAQTAQ